MQIAVFCGFSHGSLNSARYDVNERTATRIDVIFCAGDTSILGNNQRTRSFATFGTEIKMNKMLARPGIEPMTLIYPKAAQALHRLSYLAMLNFNNHLFICTLFVSDNRCFTWMFALVDNYKTMIPVILAPYYVTVHTGFMFLDLGLPPARRNIA